MIEPWFSQQVAPWFAFLALFASFSFLERYVKQGRHRTLVMTTFGLCAGVGGIFLAVAVIAKLSGQPGYVVFPFALSGVVMIYAYVDALLRARRQYTEVEMRKMAAGDL
jgi:hypothetical protein